MEEKLLEIKDLSVEYTTDEDIVKAVNHVSLTLNKGETIGRQRQMCIRDSV
mgnify:CR=1 FL=1